MHSLRTTLCVRFKSEAVACGIIFMAARRLQVCSLLYSGLPVLLCCTPYAVVLVLVLLCL